MNEKKLLDRVRYPADLRKLKTGELKQLSKVAPARTPTDATLSSRSSNNFQK